MEQGTVGGSKVGITVAVMLAAMMAVLDISIVNVALNDIRASFGTPIDQIAWVSTGYMMANVVVIPMTGWFQRRFGYRRYFVASLAVFGTSSALCGLSWSLPSLVVFRVMQGLGGGAIIPTAQSILFARYPREEHGLAQALFGMGAVTAPLLGPTVGGYLIDWASWHWIFLINVPAVVLAALLAHGSIQEPEPSRSGEGVDVAGVALLVVGMASLQYVLEEGNREGWFDSRTIVVLSAVSLIALVTFIIHELETPRPIVNLRIFANVAYAASTGINFMVGAVLFSGSFLYALYCGAVMHYAALDIGLLFMKGSAIQLVLLPVVGKLLGRVDPRPLILYGATMMVASLWVNGGLTSNADEGALILPLFIRACGLGFIFAPLNVAALSDLPAQQRGNAAGLFNLTRELGGSIGTAWMGTMLARHSKEAYTALSAHVSSFDPTSMDELLRLKHAFAGQSVDAGSAALAVLDRRIAGQSLVLAFNRGFLTLAIVFTGVVLLVPLLKRPQGARSGSGRSSNRIQAVAH